MDYLGSGREDEQQTRAQWNAMLTAEAGGNFRDVDPDRDPGSGSTMWRHQPLHDKINYLKIAREKETLGDSGFRTNFFRVVSRDYGKPRGYLLPPEN